MAAILNSEISVVIVEDDADTRKRLVAAVHAGSGLKLIADVGTYEQAKTVLRLQPDVVLVDLELPDGNGIDLIQEFQTPDSKTEFMVITVFADDKHVIPALEAGATGYLLKDTPFEDVMVSILDLCDGGSPISPRIARKLLKNFRNPPMEPLVTLTEREQEVLEMLAKGFSYTEAGEALEISYHTVVSHVQKIYKKLAVNSKSKALFEARKTGLIHN